MNILEEKVISYFDHSFSIDPNAMDNAEEGRLPGKEIAYIYHANSAFK